MPCFFSKIRNVLKRNFQFIRFFFQFLLVFEICLILYSTVVNSELGTFCEPDPEKLTSDTREPAGQGGSIQWHPGPGSKAPGGGVGGQALQKKREFTGVEPPNIKKKQNFSTKSAISQKLKIAKNRKIIFSFPSAHCASFV